MTTSGKSMQSIIAQVVEEDSELTLGELSRACGLTADRVLDLVEHGIIEPRGRELPEWRFECVALHRARSAVRLQRDLGVNLAGAALALELLDEIQRLRARLGRLDFG